MTPWSAFTTESSPKRLELFYPYSRQSILLQAEQTCHREFNLINFQLIKTFE